MIPAAIERPFSDGLSKRSFDAIKRLVYENAGIDLHAGKEQLVATRLTKLLRGRSFRSYDEYVDYLLSNRSDNSLVELIDAISTNFTSFMREPAHFEFLRRRVIPELKHRQNIHFWCAASATGEEPYSLLFSALEELGAHRGPDCRILATDISTGALATARQGTYSEERLRPLPTDWKSRYFTRDDDDREGAYRVKSTLRAQVEFRQLNLVRTFSLGCKFPLISCRNVMIYFDRPTQQRVLDQLLAHLEPGAYLFIGHSDGLVGLRHPLVFVQPAIFQLPAGFDVRKL